jgi:hypothetical protein
MTPFPRLRVMHRLVLRPAVRAGEARPAGEADGEIDAPGLRIEGHFADLPRCLQPQRDGEQGSGIHGSDLRRLACGPVDASYGPARALRAVWTTPGPRRARPRQWRAPRRRGPPVAHTLGPRAHRPTGPATSCTKCALKDANRQGRSQALTHRKRNRGKKLRQVRRREGRYLLRSNLTGNDPVQLWTWYIQLTEVEQAFKELKGDLSVRPIYHQMDRRIEAHIFVAFLAYCLQVTLKARLRPLAPGLTPRSALEKFAAIQMVDVHLPTTDGRTLILSRYTEPEADQQLLLDRLNLQLPAQPPPRITAALQAPIH